MSGAAHNVLEAVSPASDDRAWNLDTDAMLTAHFEAMDANMPPNLDPDALAGRFAEDCLHTQPLRQLPGGPARGQEAYRRFFATFDAHWAIFELLDKKTFRFLQSSGYRIQRAAPERFPVDAARTTLLTARSIRA